jgi:hypothetical protein
LTLSDVKPMSTSVKPVGCGTFGDAERGGPSTVRIRGLSRASTLAALGSAVLLAAILGACRSDDHPVIVIENRLADPVTVVFLNSSGQESPLVTTISPGLEYSVDVFPTDRCTPGVLIARDVATGAEVARSQSPVCRPSRWIIAAPAESSTRSRRLARFVTALMFDRRVTFTVAA